MHSELAALFRARERNDGGWGKYDQETDDLIATMIETALRERLHRESSTFFANFNRINQWNDSVQRPNARQVTTSWAIHFANTNYRGNSNTPW